jgi:hypothetical protein
MFHEVALATIQATHRDRWRWGCGKNRPQDERPGSGRKPTAEGNVLLHKLLAAALLLIATPTWALVDLLGRCDQTTGEFQFTVIVVNDLLDGDTVGTSIVLEQTLAGSCDKPVLAPIPDLPLPAFLQEATYTFALGAPWPQRTWRYQAMLRHPDGQVEPLGPFGEVTPVVALSWGAAPAVRGTLEADATGPWFHIVPCVQDCGHWLCYENLDLSRIHTAQYEAYLRSGEPVDVHGEFLVTAASGGACLYVTAVEPAKGDPCAAIPVATSSWGSLKSSYR